MMAMKAEIIDRKGLEYPSRDHVSVKEEERRKWFLT